MAEYLSAPRLNPNRSDIHEDLGRAFAAAGFRDYAIKEFEITVALRPSAAHFNLLGIAYAQKGAMNKAIENFRMAASLDGSREDYRRNLMSAF